MDEILGFHNPEPLISLQFHTPLGFWVCHRIGLLVKNLLEEMNVSVEAFVLHALVDIEDLVMFPSQRRLVMLQEISDKTKTEIGKLLKPKASLPP